MTTADVKRELSWLYRSGLNGKMPWHDCTRAAHVLSVIARLIEGAEMEKRIEALEQAAAGSLAPRRSNGEYRDHR